MPNLTYNMLMDNFKIASLKSRQVLDSRGNPTVETDVFLNTGHVGRAIVPSGASTGTGEALELRDNDPKYYNGKSVFKAVWNVNTRIADVLTGNSADQKSVDHLLLQLDGTEDKSELGANAILSVSLATAKAVAKAHHQHFYEYIADLAGTRADMSLPIPMMNVMNGGAHADWSTDFQEYMVMPLAPTTMENKVRAGAEIFHALKDVLKENGYATTVGDEGGYAPKWREGNNEPLEYIKEAVARTEYEFGRDIVIAMDIAASEFHDGDHYVLKTNGDWKWSDNLVDWYTWIVDNYPVVSIEDGLDENDWDGWKKLGERLGSRTQLVGDDLFVTNTKLLEKGIAEHVANAILIKPNQIGTLTETFAAVNMAKRAGYGVILSHRSGETEDSSLAHLAVGLGAGQIKTGSLSRSERIAKYNELMRISEGNPELQFDAAVAARLRYNA